MGLWGATGIGVGAIVGGGILALAGIAFATTGPAAMLAFALNGVIAGLTALSLAEMASKFPQSGGTYTYAKKALSVESAFAVGWVVWFASVVASVLYAVGFAHFILILVDEIIGGGAPWLAATWTKTLVAIGATTFIAIDLARRVSGGGPWVNVGKLVVFGLLVLAGLVAVVRQGSADTSAALEPFFTAGFGGLIQAMGYTFIALQGFDLIAAVGGEVREPAKTLPRAMLLSLLIALSVYLPLLFVIATVGTPAGQPIGSAAAADPEGIVATAAQSFLGPIGYWFVIVAAILSMYSALQANLFAASRIAQTMAADRTLPETIGRLHQNRGTPAAAIALTAALVAIVLVLVRDVNAAGAAASLIFLLTFAIAHLLAFLIRRRSVRRPPPFRTPFFPLVPILGGTACLGLALFQGIVVPAAGGVTAVWLGIGGVLFLGLFAQRARLLDATNTAIDPELVTLRGQVPLVLVPVANPSNAEAMIFLADSLVPAEVGRVLAQSIVVPPAEWNPDEQSGPIERSQTVLHRLLTSAAKNDISVEALTSIAERPMEEIARVAELHRCETVLLGLSEISEESQTEKLESLLGRLDANVVVLRSRHDWQPSVVRRVMIPIAGRGGHQTLLARLLGSMQRGRTLEITFIRMVPASTTADETRRIERELRTVAGDLNVNSKVEVIASEDAIQSLVNRCGEADLLILGVQRAGGGQRLFGSFTRQVASRTECPIIFMSQRR